MHSPKSFQPNSTFTILPRFRRRPFLPVGAYGIGEVVTPVLDYLGCLYSSADNEKPQGGFSEGSLPGKQSNSNSARETELLELYRRVLDGHGAAPGP